MSGTRCTCGAGCATFGICMRKKGIRVSYCGVGGQDASAQKAWDKELHSYYGAVAQGVEPAGTSTRQIRDALDKSDKVGQAYNAADPAPAFFGVKD